MTIKILWDGMRMAWMLFDMQNRWDTQMRMVVSIVHRKQTMGRYSVFTKDV